MIGQTITKLALNHMWERDIIGLKGISLEAYYEVNFKQFRPANGILVMRSLLSHDLKRLKYF